MYVMIKFYQMKWLNAHELNSQSSPDVRNEMAVSKNTTSITQV